MLKEMKKLFKPDVAKKVLYVYGGFEILCFLIGSIKEGFYINNFLNLLLVVLLIVIAVKGIDRKDKSMVLVSALPIIIRYVHYLLASSTEAGLQPLMSRPDFTTGFLATLIIIDGVCAAAGLFSIVIGKIYLKTTETMDTLITISCIILCLSTVTTIVWGTVFNMFGTGLISGILYSLKDLMFPVVLLACNFVTENLKK